MSCQKLLQAINKLKCHKAGALIKESEKKFEATK